MQIVALNLLNEDRNVHRLLPLTVMYALTEQAKSFTAECEQCHIPCGAFLCWWLMLGCLVCLNQTLVSFPLLTRLCRCEHCTENTTSEHSGSFMVWTRSKPTTISLSYSTPRKLVFFCILCWKVLQMCSGLCGIPTSWEMNQFSIFSHSIFFLYLL